MSAEFSIRHDLEFTVQECPGCGTIYAVLKTINTARRQDGKTFRCTNPSCPWTTQSYTETEIQRLQTQLDAERRRLEFETRGRRLAEEQRMESEKKLAKLQRRISAGACPCCKRAFVNLARHMKTKHPEFGT